MLDESPILSEACPDQNIIAQNVYKKFLEKNWNNLVQYSLKKASRQDNSTTEAENALQEACTSIWKDLVENNTRIVGLFLSQNDDGETQILKFLKNRIKLVELERYKKKIRSRECHPSDSIGHSNPNSNIRETSVHPYSPFRTQGNQDPSDILAFEQILTTFSPIDRQLVHLRAKGHSTLEIANLLGKKESTVEKCLTNIKKAMRERLKAIDSTHN